LEGGGDEKGKELINNEWGGGGVRILARKIRSFLLL